MISHRSTRDAVVDLKKNGRLIEIDTPLSPRLEIAEIQRRVYARKGPAVLFTNPVNTRFPMVSNLFGSLDQARFLFRHTLDRVRRAIELKIDPNALFRNPLRYISAPSTAWAMLPKRTSSGPVLSHSCEISDLPHLVSWPTDGGPFALHRRFARGARCAEHRGGDGAARTLHRDAAGGRSTGRVFAQLGIMACRHARIREPAARAVSCVRAGLTPMRAPP